MTSPALTATPRIEGVEKVSGTAKYAYEQQFEGLAYGWVHGARIAKGRVLSVNAASALEHPGVIAVFWHRNTPKLVEAPDSMLDVLQNDLVDFRGQVVALVVAETPEAAREAAMTLEVDYDEEPFEVVLTTDHAGLHAPEKVNGGQRGLSVRGDPDAAFAASAIQLDHSYSTPGEHNNPMEPHASVARWRDGALTLHDSSQGGNAVQQMLSTMFGIEPGHVHVVNHHVGGGFGSKGTPRATPLLAALAARELGRPVKLALTRQQLFDLVGYRTPTIQRIRLGADPSGKLTSISHESIQQTSTRTEFTEQTSVCSRVMYAAEHRRTAHQVTALDVPTPSWMRAPGEAPGMFALESAMDELAIAAGLDPIELRMRNEPTVNPDDGRPFSSRNLLACLTEGARRFGWEQRRADPRSWSEGRWLIGHGVASSTYPVYIAPSTARVSVDAHGLYVLSINATDIGTGARTALQAIAADELGVTADRVIVLIGDTALPPATIAGGSMGTASWGWAVAKACRQLLELIVDHQGIPAAGLSAQADTSAEVKGLPKQSRDSFGAQFVEVRVDQDSGEVRVPRMVGVFAAGRIINAVTAQSQFVGGMTMGLSMALHEHGVMDPQFGDFANRDLATYHMAANADVPNIEVAWIDEVDRDVNLLGVKGIGEIGIVGTAAAIANAVYNATGVRVRDLPITLEKLL